MRELAAFVKALDLPLSRVRWWDVSEGVITKAMVEASGWRDYVCAVHRTPKDWIGVILFYGQYFFVTGSTDHIPIVRFGAEVAFWRLEQGKQPVEPDFAQMPEIRNPWYGDTAMVTPSFYLSPEGAGYSDNELILRVLAHLNDADYEFAGRLVGFDFPKEFYNKEFDRLRRSAAEQRFDIRNP